MKKENQIVVNAGELVDELLKQQEALNGLVPRVSTHVSFRGEKWGHIELMSRDGKSVFRGNLAKQFRDMSRKATIQSRVHFDRPSEDGQSSRNSYEVCPVESYSKVDGWGLNDIVLSKEGRERFAQLYDQMESAEPQMKRMFEKRLLAKLRSQDLVVGDKSKDIKFDLHFAHAYNGHEEMNKDARTISTVMTDVTKRIAKEPRVKKRSGKAVADGVGIEGEV
jgi:hypothetical protein